MKKAVFSAYAADPEALQNRFALRVAARLNEAALTIAPDVSERLRFARERALQSAREARQRIAAPSNVMLGTGGAAVLGGGHDGATGWWVKLASALPLIALVAGLILIQRGHACLHRLAADHGRLARQARPGADRRELRQLRP